MLAALLLTVGCSSGGTHAAPPLPEPPLGSTVPPANGRAGMKGGPLSAYQGDEAQSARQEQLVKVLTVSCMRKAGYQDYQGEDLGVSPADHRYDASQVPAGPFGYLGADLAATQAFRPPLGDAQGSQTAVHRSPQEQQAAETCFQQAFGGLPKLADDVSGGLFGQAIERVPTDSRVVAATAQWKACMKAAGFQVADPGSLWPARKGPGAPGADEIALAKGDEACTRQSNLAGVYFAVLYGYQQELIDRNGPALAQLREQIAQRDAEEAKMLASAGN